MEQSTEDTNFTGATNSFLIKNWKLRKSPEKCRSDGLDHNLRYLGLDLTSSWQWPNPPLPFSPVNFDEVTSACFLRHFDEGYLIALKPDVE